MSLSTNDLVARKFGQFTRLSPGDRLAISSLTGEGIRQFAARTDIVREGDTPTCLRLFLSGWACRYKMLEDGRRQIVAFLLPGDLCDLNIFLLREMDHSIGTIVPVTLAEIAPAAIERVMDAHARVAKALLWEQLVTAAMQREWTLNLGQRSALERVAHLFCELFLRLRGVGLTEGGRCELPLTQADMGEATGLSTVHINRTVQELRSRGLIVLRGKELVIPDLAALQDAAGFNVNYLHLDREGRQFDTNEG
ncbi:Crp/Fnr family transcriptional regulator [Muricoccus radiodurans]|uniref:Crp/Fnr family transcriptional regulator n=1 Tax=Muricoccus radiodurans TaxID=2231721 RepID=UPI003CF52A82